jgi:hypothetical protein
LVEIEFNPSDSCQPRIFTNAADDPRLEAGRHPPDWFSISGLERGSDRKPPFVAPIKSRPDPRMINGLPFGHSGESMVYETYVE